MHMSLIHVVYSKVKPNLVVGLTWVQHSVHTCTCSIYRYMYVYMYNLYVYMYLYVYMS